MLTKSIHKNKCLISISVNRTYNKYQDSLFHADKHSLRSTAY